MAEGSIDMLLESLGKYIFLRLRDNMILQGKLMDFDQHMNLVLEDVTDLTESNHIHNLRVIIVRGDSVLTIIPTQRQKNDNST
jgi:small nuclear ribonucleoprotein (snRNP)-like protein